MLMISMSGVFLVLMEETLTKFIFYIYFLEDGKESVLFLFITRDF